MDQSIRKDSAAGRRKTAGKNLTVMRPSGSSSKTGKNGGPRKAAFGGGRSRVAGDRTWVPLEESGHEGGPGSSRIP